MKKNYFKLLTIVAIGLLFSGNVQSQIVTGGDCASADAWSINGDANATLAWGDATVPTGATSATSVKIDYGIASWGEVQISQLVTLEKGKVYSLSANVKTTDNNHLEKWGQGFILDHDVAPDGTGKYTDGSYPGRDTVKLLSLTNYGNDADFSIDGAFPKVGDYGPCAETFVATADAATYPVLFKFGGNVPVVTVYLTDITVTELRDAAVDATLKSLMSDATSVPSFDAATMSYDIELAAGAAVPVVTAEVNEDNAKVVITQADAIPGAATVVVTAEDRLTVKTYTINYTGPTGINNNEVSNISVYPTPAHNVLYVSGIENSANVSIYSVSGSLVANFENVTNQINISELTAGMYFVNVVEGTHNIVKKVIIK